MKGAYQFLWEMYVKITLGSTAVIAVLALVVNQTLRVQYLATYYYMLPMMFIIFVSIYSFNLTILPRNMALSMNCRRADFFWASQLAFAVTDVVSVLIVWLAGVAPKALGWEYASLGESHFVHDAPVFADPAFCLYLLAVCLFLQPIGAAAGCLYERHKVAATIFVIVVMLLGVIGTVLLMFVSDGSIPEAIVRTIGGVSLAAVAVIGLLSDVYFYRTNAKAVVR